MISEYYGKTIIDAEIVHETILRITFEGGEWIEVHDRGRECCESRYMRTDDDLSFLVGCEFRSLARKAGEVTHHKTGMREATFIEIHTNKGFVTIANHNDHNGFYAGISLTVADSRGRVDIDGMGVS